MPGGVVGGLGSRRMLNGAHRDMPVKGVRGMVLLGRGPTGAAAAAGVGVGRGATGGMGRVTGISTMVGLGPGTVSPPTADKPEAVTDPPPVEEMKEEEPVVPCAAAWDITRANKAR